MRYVGWMPVALICHTPALAAPPTVGDRRPSIVRVEKTDTGYRLLRNSAPYVIKGAGGRNNLDALVEAGGNSIRTWHTHNLGRTLDEAYERGLSVTVGMWLGHERHGFDYSNPQDVARDRDRALQAVVEYKDHPAVLMWGIGNEMEGDGDNPLIWKAVDDIAKRIKDIDPNHPTMTVVAGTGHDKVRELIEHCPHIDVIGVNAYGDLSRIPGELKQQGLDRPYVITEFGPYGWWQVGKTPWGAELEPTSTQKAETYLESYKVAVAGEPRCLGAYAFLWGDKQEHTRTWFGMFLPSGERTAAVDVMSREWTGQWPANRCPRISALTVEMSGESATTTQPAAHVYPTGAKIHCSVQADDPDGDKLVYRWELRSESTDRRSGGDREQAPPDHPDAIVNVEGHNITLRAPQTAGPYRVFVYVVDGHNNAATANVPILVK